MARFVGASSHYMFNTSTRITGYPFTIGFWYRPILDIINYKELVVLTNADGVNDFQLTQDSSDFVFYAEAAGTAFPGASAVGAFALNKYTYCLARGISSTNRRVSTLSTDGVVIHGQNTQALAPAAMAVSSIAAFSSDISATGVTFADGDIAEVFMADVDIVPGNGQIPREMLWQLAYRGPFSFPHIRANIVEYLSLKENRSSREDKGRKSLVGRRGYAPWTAFNNFQRSASPPLIGGSSYRFQRNPLSVLPI